MKILYISDIFGYITGAPKSAIDVLINLLSSNNKITVLSNSKRIKLIDGLNDKESNLADWITVPKYNSFPTEFNRKIHINLAKWMRSILQKIIYFGNVNRLKILNPDIIFVNSLGGDILYNRYKIKTLRSKTIMILRGSPDTFTLGHDKSFDIDNIVKELEKYHSIIFVSSIVRDKWLLYQSLKSKQVFYIPNCCEEEKTELLLKIDSTKVRKKLDILDNSFAIVCVSTLQYRKGQDILIKAFSDISKIAPHAILYLVGPIIYPWGDELLKEIQKQNKEDRIKVIGKSNISLDYIYAADVLILPTRSEAMPRVILEAMALKTPIISTDVDGIPELVENEVNGLLVPAEKPDRIVEAFKILYNDEKKREKYSDLSYKKYWSNFSRKMQISRYKKMLNTIAKK